MEYLLAWMGFNYLYSSQPLPNSPLLGGKSGDLIVNECLLKILAKKELGGSYDDRTSRQNKKRD